MILEKLCNVSDSIKEHIYAQAQNKMTKIVSILDKPVYELLAEGYTLPEHIAESATAVPIEGKLYCYYGCSVLVIKVKGTQAVIIPTPFPLTRNYRKLERNKPLVVYIDELTFLKV